VIFRDLCDRSQEAKTLAAAAAQVAVLGDLPGALERLDHAEALARGADDPSALARVERARASVAPRAG
jgi:hypothetical protein